jgi:NAD(P)-dependent dehydrogenase (short-subunit alcohol dehydrogenase family)
VSEQEFQTPNNAWRLDGQVALVTGTTSGLGNRFARVLAAAHVRTRRHANASRADTELKSDVSIDPAERAQCAIGDRDHRAGE